MDILNKITIEEFQDYFDQMFVASTRRRLDMHYTSETHKVQEQAAEAGEAVTRGSIQALKKNCALYVDSAMANFSNN